MSTKAKKESAFMNFILPKKISLSRVYKKELILGLFFFLIYPVALFFFPIITSEPTSARHILFKLGSLSIILIASFNSIFNSWNKYKLDEREWRILNKASGAATFILIFFLIFLYTFGGQIKTFTGATLNDQWAFYMCPVFLLAHATTAFILDKTE